MNPWEMEKWRGKHISNETRKGVYMRSDAGVDEDVRGACKRFLQWMRRNYEFPVRVVIYLKKYERIRASDGDLCTGIFYEPLDEWMKPYAYIATGDYQETLQSRGRDNALAGILFTIAHELTHYQQWLNQLSMTQRGKEWQATFYANRMLDEYAETTDHP